MKYNTLKFIFLAFLVLGISSSCNQNKNKKKSIDTNIDTNIDNSLIGKWVKFGPMGPMIFNFKDNGLVEGDFGDDQTIDVIDKYEVKNDTIKFTDKQGQMCAGFGLYKIYQTDYYLAFDLIEDDCGGRIKTTMGFWTRPNFKDFLAVLDREISNSPEPELLLNRARVYMALGKSKQAKADFDNFILKDSTNARVYINRAGTRFPQDLNGVINDCNKAIALVPNNKNAYFLRGLARYDLGEHEKACEDFNKAIKLGFSVLKFAEQERCSEFWNEEKE